MAGPGFVHLHTHSEFSLLDGAARLDGLVKRAAELEMPALALTDHGVMHGAIDFYLKCKEVGIKPIIGVEAYITPGKLTERSRPEHGKNAYHLLLLAKDLQGYKNLLKLTTVAAVEGFYYKPRIDFDLLQQHHEGIIATSACLGGEVCSALLAGDYRAALETAGKYRDLFGPERYFIELQNHSLQKQIACNEQLVKIARELGLKLLCTNDIHYLGQKDAEAHEVLLCIGTGATMLDPNRFRYEADQFYMKSAAEMAQLFADFPEALEQTVGIADGCDLQLEFGRAPLPAPEVPAGHTPISYLRALALDGLKNKVERADTSDPADSYRQRLEYELGIVEQTGFAPYFLIVRDFAKFARERGIFFGVRGSAAGSLTSFCVDITDIDPVEYELTFERFLNPERIQMPDIDMDFEDARRSEVIEYVTHKYGKDHVAQIVTFGTLAAKAAIKDAGRALGVPLQECNRVAGLIPALPIGITIERALEDNPEFRNLYRADAQVRKLVDTARRLEGISRHASVHAAGVIISHEPLVEYTPLQKTQEGAYVTQYPAGALEKIGLLKMDFLGLINLSILGRAIENIRQSRGIEIDVQQIPLDDAKAFELLGRGDTTGIFQLESQGMRRYVAELKPGSVRDLAAMVALYRPGPMAHIPQFIRARHGLEKIQYPHPLLKEVLEETYGVIVYQDQVMRIAQVIAGYTLGQADILRRAMGKKKKEEMARERKRFIAGAAERGIPEKKAAEIFNLIEPFAGYAFNKAHAVCYAMLAYQTAYLKANYPVEYMAALLACYTGKTDKVATCMEECRRMGIRVLPPDVNQSGVDYSAESVEGCEADLRAVRFGLAGIKNVGRAAVDAILTARQAGGAFTSLHDFCTRTQEQGTVTRATIESLIKCGAFRSLHPNRRALMQVLDSACSLAARAERDRRQGQSALFSGAADEVRETEAPAYAPDLPDFSTEELLAFEKDLLGIYVSDHPLEKHRARIQAFATATAETIQEAPDRQEVKIGGIITAVKPFTSKRSKEPMAFFHVEDLTGRPVSVTAFPAVYREYARQIQKDAIVLIEGRVSCRERVMTDEEGGSMEVLAEKVIPIGSGTNGHGNGRRRALVIQLDGGMAHLVSPLRRLLEENPGPEPVCLQIRQNGRLVRLRTNEKHRRPLLVDADAVHAAVADIIGRERVRLM